MALILGSIYIFFKNAPKVEAATVTHTITLSDITSATLDSNYNTTNLTPWKAYACKNRGTGWVSVGYNVDSSSSRNFNARDTVPKGEVITVSSITLDEVTTANISIPSGSTECISSWP